MERLMRDAERLAGYEIGSLKTDNFADVIEAIHLVQEEMGITGTTAQEASTTIEGSVSSMQAAWSNWLTELGKDNGDVAARTQELINSVFGDGEGNPGVVGNIVPRVLQIGEQIIASLPDIMSRIGAVIHDNIVPKLDEITGGKASEFIEAFEGIGKKVGEVFENLKPHIDNLIEQFGPVLTDVILPALKTAFEGIGGVVEIVGAAIGVVVDIISGFLAIVNAVVDAINSAREAAANFAAENGGNAAQVGSYNSPVAYHQAPSGYNGGGGGGHYAMADGGRVTGPTYALIGEAGYDEYVVPNTRTGMQPLADNLADELGRRDDELIASIYSVRDEIKDMGVYLDGSKLVGGIQSRMSRALVMR